MGKNFGFNFTSMLTKEILNELDQNEIVEISTVSQRIFPEASAIFAECAKQMYFVICICINLQHEEGKLGILQLFTNR